MRLFADDAAAASRELDLGPVIVVASSMACMVAVEMAVAYPDSVAALVLVGGFPTLPAAGKERFEERARLVESEGMEAVVDAVIAAGFGATTHATQPGLVGLYRDLLLRNESSCYAAACRAIAKADVSALLPKVDHPTLILIGAEEQVAPLSAARALKEGMSHAMLRVLPGAGHLPFLEQLAEFNAALQQFIGLIPRGTGPASSGRRLGFT
jgi:3-oxoadipate enol-lactonase